MQFDLVPLLIIVFSLVFVGAGCWVLFRYQWLIQWLKGTGGLLLIGIAVYMSLMAVNLYSYHELKPEQPIATVSFRKQGDQRYMANVAQPDGSSRDYALSGDLWQLDARIIRWKGFFRLLGFRPGYQLDRLQGRYLSLEDELSKDRTVYEVNQDALGIDVWRRTRESWSMMVDASYGSATFVPMAEGAIFEVTLSDTGLVARPLNGSAQRAISQWE